MCGCILRHECDSLVEMLRELIGVLCDKAEEGSDMVMPRVHPYAAGPTHPLWPSHDGVCGNVSAGYWDGCKMRKNA